jgi:tetratricopeptide (TPR) repeat protein
VAFAVRLVHVWQIRDAPFFTVLMGDSRAYDEWARRIAAGDWIGTDVFYQAPLYPYFLGVIYAIAGHHLLLVRVVQAVLGSLACVFLMLAGWRLFSPRVGIIAGLILALYAPAIFFDGLIQKSVLDVFFVCLALWLIANIATTYNAENAEPAEQKRSPPVQRALRLPSSWVWLGLAIGGLTLTRENALVFTAVIALWAAFAPPNQRRFGGQGRTARVRNVAAFLLGLAIVVLPVAIRNSLVSGGGFYVTTSQFGPNFYIGNNPRADGTYQSLRFGRGAPEYERQDATEIAERAEGRRLTPGEVSSYWTGRALDFITGRPVEWLRLVGRKIALLINAREMLDTESQETHAEWSVPLRLSALAGHFGVLIPLALLGIIATWPMRSKVWVLYAMLIAYAGSVVLFYVFARYRYPLVPFLVLFAAAGLTELFEVVRVRMRSFGGERDRSDGNAIVRARWPTIAAVVIAGVFANWPILSADMNRAVTEHNLGAALQSDGRYDEAIAHYRRALALEPNYAPAFNNMASTFRAKGDLREAVATYGLALEIKPDYPEAHYNLANALLEAGKPDEAIDHFQQALQSIAGSADVHNNLGIALAGKGRLDEAVAEFREALRLDPDSARAHRNLGDALASQGSRDEAIQHLRRAVQLAPDDASAHYDLGSVLLEAGNLDDAVTEFRATLRLTPDAVEAHNNLGIALGSQGKLDEAIAEFEAALKIKPDFADARRNRAMALAARRGR